MLGSASALVANPLTILLSQPTFLRLRDHLVMSIFIALFRAVLISQVENARRPASAPSPPLAPPVLLVPALVFSA
jgi:hypothetical protein